jgi:hypothetical protein
MNLLRCRLEQDVSHCAQVSLVTRVRYLPTANLAVLSIAAHSRDAEPGNLKSSRRRTEDLPVAAVRAVFTLLSESVHLAEIRSSVCLTSSLVPGTSVCLTSSLVPGIRSTYLSPSLPASAHCRQPRLS